MKKKTKPREKVGNGSVGECENGSEQTTATVITDKESHEGDANGVEIRPPPCDESDNKSAENGAVSNGNDTVEVSCEAEEANGEAAEANGEATASAVNSGDLVENGANGSEEADTNGTLENGVEQGKQIASGVSVEKFGPFILYPDLLLHWEYEMSPFPG